MTETDPLAQIARLSPAAQAVLDAFTEDNFLHDWKHNYYNTDALAAALRAAAKELSYGHGSDAAGLIMEDDILLIANELDAYND